MVEFNTVRNVGGDGIAIALVVLLLLLYVLPALFKRRRVLNEAVIDEKYAQELRIIQGRTHKIQPKTNVEHGTIFTTERKMKQVAGAKAARRPKTLDVRAVARKRSQAKARIAKRYVYHVRGMAIGTVAVVLTVLFWILAGTTTFPTLAAAISTGAGAVYLASLTYLIRVWQKSDEIDRARVAKYDALLQKSGGKFRDVAAAGLVAHQGSKDSDDAASVIDVEAEATHEAEVLPVGMTFDQISRASRRPQARKSGEVTGSENRVQASVERSGEVREAEVGSRSRVVMPQTSGVRVPAPSYTIKPRIHKRAVKPFEAAEEASAAVPYRPAKMGERFSDVAVEAPNAAPEMTGNEELRKDLLGGGAMLDSLLDRRRA
ncbi:DUF6667 domain-containing protein [Arcanobacterium ihumii]|uniref:DUF6667 domain-containing protein n=1 Tax=Arcanobacterium ihumii TaxID=2138162 RepID=UPI000F54866D|nr:DUF6667 domain-containing protein [Arcanobacterium ihumii]